MKKILIGLLALGTAFSALAFEKKSVIVVVSSSDNGFFKTMSGKKCYLERRDNELKLDVRNIERPTQNTDLAYTVEKRVKLTRSDLEELDKVLSHASKKTPVEITIEDSKVSQVRLLE